MKPWPALAPFAQTLSLPGGELFYYDSVGGELEKPAIVFIHGLGDEADTWRYMFPPLIKAGYRVIAPDLPGFGRSRWTGKISIEGHCEAVMRLMAHTEAASAQRPAVLAGNSLGTGLAEIIAGKQPDLVKALILIDGCFPMDLTMNAGFLFLALPKLGERWYRGFRSNHEAAWKSLYPYYADLENMNSTDKDFLRERVIARVESDNQERGYFSTLRSMIKTSALGKKASSRNMQAWPGKIALIWGEKDRMFTPDKSALFRSLRPDAEYTVISGAGHLPHQEKPEETLAVIEKFLQSVLKNVV